jgi:hypothetical protein
MSRAAGDPDAAVAAAYLRTPAAIRARCEHVLARGLAGELAHFTVDLARLDDAAARVEAVTRAAYPDLAIPYHSRWNHFRAGGVDRVADFRERIASLPAIDQARAKIGLVVTSVLLDAGAGDRWGFVESRSATRYTRSEGLAVASYHMFVNGAFSSDSSQPTQADVAGLATMDAARLARGFQVSDDNPLVGLEGRAALLVQLGAALHQSPHIFRANATSKIGGLFDYIQARSVSGVLRASTILAAVLEGLGPIWPGRVELAGVNLGDTWPHPAAGGTGAGAGLVPFHKLSQWLTYSLIEPFEEAGLIVTGVDELTGLPEYRNGGLFVDTGVLVPRHAAVTGARHRPGDETIVEWRGPRSSRAAPGPPAASSPPSCAAASPPSRSTATERSSEKESP